MTKTREFKESDVIVSEELGKMIFICENQSGKDKIKVKKVNTVKSITKEKVLTVKYLNSLIRKPEYELLSTKKGVKKQAENEKYEVSGFHSILITLFVIGAILAITSAIQGILQIFIK